MENEVKAKELSNVQSVEVTPVTPNTSEVAPVTLATPLPDVQADKLKELETKLQKREEDINKLKSSLQKSQELERKQWELEKKKMQDDLNAVKLSSMTDEQKKQFEREQQLEEAQSWKERATRLEQSIEEKQIAANYIEYFKSVGVANEKLVLDQGIDTLVNSGWAGLQEVVANKDAKIRELEAKMLNPLSATEVAQAPQRTPITSQQISTNPGMTWKDVADKYGNGNLDKVYTRIERGELPPSILPQEE